MIGVDRRVHGSWRIAVPLAVVALWCVGLHVESLHLVLLYMAPALTLFALFATDRFPAEELFERLVSRMRARVKRPRAATPAGRAPRRLVPRGGLLLASGLASRPPPLR